MANILPTVSVIVPVYNGAKTIEGCIQSLLEQNYPRDLFDITVVENGSTDATSAIVAVYPVQLLHCPERGPAAARNLGISCSKGEIVAFTDSDCIAHPDWLLELVKPYTDSSVVGVGGAILASTHSDRNLYERFSEEHSPLVNFISGEHEFLPHLYTANASYRRDALNKVGDFNPHLITGEDVDLAWRIQLLTGLSLQYNPEAIIFHRHRATRTGLGRQYRNYGFGEIVLDTLYGHHHNYPRSRQFQIRRIAKQMAVLPRYIVSGVIRYWMFVRGRISSEQAAMPFLWLLIESHNVRGKLDAMFVTRLMTSTAFLFKSRPESYINRYY